MKKTAILTIAFMLMLAGCSSQKQSIDSETQLAETTLTSFFDNLSQQKFDKAVEFFTSDQEMRNNLSIYGPEQKTGKADIMENYCTSVPSCLKVNIRDAKKMNDGEYTFKVQFHQKDGKLFILGPCCGATEKEMPPQDTFDFTVKKIDGIFKVTTPPVYVP